MILTKEEVNTLINKWDAVFDALLQFFECDDPSDIPLSIYKPVDVMVSTIVGILEQ